MLQFQPIVNWEKLPAGYSWSEVAGVAVDANDRVFVFNRGAHPMIVFDRDGRFLYSWGEGVFQRPHGVTIGREGTVFCTDDADHTIREFTEDGRLLMTIGRPGVPSDTGATSVDYRTIRHAAGPFHFPTNLAQADDGRLFVADGYGNARIHRFSRQGALESSWGEPGNGPGQFHVPHGIAIDSQERIYVADRENSRIQRFDREGRFIDQWQDIARPCQVAIDPTGRVFVAELGYRAGMWPGTSAPMPNATGGRVSVFDGEGKLLARWGGGDHPTAPGDFFAPHDLCIDSQGAVYVAEVMMSAGGNRGLVDPSCHALQKFLPT